MRTLVFIYGVFEFELEYLVFDKYSWIFTNTYRISKYIYSAQEFNYQKVFEFKPNTQSWWIAALNKQTGYTG